jgi:hypothetical protein
MPELYLSKFSDIYGDHAISCGTEGERIARHNHLRDTLYHTCASAALAPTIFLKLGGFYPFN